MQQCNSENYLKRFQTEDGLSSIDNSINQITDTIYDNRLFNY